MPMNPPYQTVIQLRTETRSSEDVIYLKLHLRSESVAGGPLMDMSSQPLILSIEIAQDLMQQLAKQLAALQSAKVAPPTTPDQHH
jgi:hypothetical protein